MSFKTSTLDRFCDVVISISLANVLRYRRRFFERQCAIQKRLLAIRKTSPKKNFRRPDSSSTRTLEWRTIPGQKTDRVLNAVRKVIGELSRTDPDFSCDIDAGRFDESFETSASSELVQFLAQASARPCGTVAFGTEAPTMIALGAEAVVFGPGDIRVAHRTGEFVPIDELNQSVEILLSAIRRFCL